MSKSCKCDDGVKKIGVTSSIIKKNQMMHWYNCLGCKSTFVDLKDRTTHDYEWRYKEFTDIKMVKKEDGSWVEMSKINWAV